jgi:type IV secretory pathway TrbL component
MDHGWVMRAAEEARGSAAGVSGDAENFGMLVDLQSTNRRAKIHQRFLCCGRRQ